MLNARSIVLSLALLVFATAASAPRGTDRADATDTEIAEAERSMEQGVAAAEQGDHERALRYYERAATLVPKANLPHRYAGDSLRALNRQAEAKAAYERYLSIKPEVSDAEAVREKMRTLEAR